MFSNSSAEATAGTIANLSDAARLSPSPDDAEPAAACNPGTRTNTDAIVKVPVIVSFAMTQPYWKMPVR
jgi:hypothetical protein